MPKRRELLEWEGETSAGIKWSRVPVRMMQDEETTDHDLASRMTRSRCVWGTGVWMEGLFFVSRSQKVGRNAGAAAPELIR